MVPTVSAVSAAAKAVAQAAAATAERENLGRLLMDFLQLWGEDFQAGMEGFSVRRGGLRFSVLGTPRHPQASDPVVIEDPLNVINNVGRSSFNFVQVQRVFSEAHSQLRDCLMGLQPPGPPVASTVRGTTYGGAFLAQPMPHGPSVPPARHTQHFPHAQPMQPVQSAQPVETVQTVRPTKHEDQPQPRGRAEREVPKRKTNQDQQAAQPVQPAQPAKETEPDGPSQATQEPQASTSTSTTAVSTSTPNTSSEEIKTSNESLQKTWSSVLRSPPPTNTSPAPPTDHSDADLSQQTAVETKDVSFGESSVYVPPPEATPNTESSASASSGLKGRLEVLEVQAAATGMLVHILSPYPEWEW